jgi:chromosome partitioning protein
MAMKIVTLLNEKGGVGKTTLSTHIAAGLAVRGRRVILIDSDPQGHAGAMFGLEPEAGLYDLLVRNAPFRDVLRVIPAEIYQPPDMPAKGLLAIVPSNLETRNIPNMISNIFAVKQRLDELAEFADVVIFDTSPTPSLLHGAIYIATNGIIYPTELSALSFKSLMESMHRRGQFVTTKSQMGLGDIFTLGIVPTKARLKTVEHSENLAVLKEQYGKLVWPPISLSITWEESAMQHKPVFSYAPESVAAKQGWRLIDRVDATIEKIP